LDDGREIAVKKLSHSSNQGKKEFMNEAKLLARVQHRNIVNLLGYCAHGVEKLLVYEYVANESLDKLLFSKYQLKVYNSKFPFPFSCFCLIILHLFFISWMKLNWLTLACLSFNLNSYNCSEPIYVSAKLNIMNLDFLSQIGVINEFWTFESCSGSIFSSDLFRPVIFFFD
jgi:serine/threonine protein kinase